VDQRSQFPIGSVHNIVVGRPRQTDASDMRRIVPRID
jgi:hypothetical protein